MTERRDRLADAQPSPSGRPASVGRALGPHLSRRRIAIAAAALSGVVGVGWLVLWVADSARGWLHGRPEYAIPFDQIELRPEPPAEVRGGARGLLERVRNRAKLDDSIPLLTIDLEDLGRAFAKYAPWIAKVERVERAYPNRLSVSVVYHRRPVARVKSAMDPSGDLAVTETGIAIPGEDVSPAILGSLPILSGFEGLSEVRPGRFLGLDRSGEMLPEVASGLALARFFAGAGATEAGPLRILQIDATNAPGMWMVRTALGWVVWRHAPGEETGAEEKAADKLALLKRWQLRNPRAELGLYDYLYFKEGRVEIGHGEKPKS